jgi:hypothetical protein
MCKCTNDTGDLPFLITIPCLTVLFQLNDDYYECLTPESTIALLEACKAGKPPAMGRWGSLPMNGQVGFFLVMTFMFFKHLCAGQL